MKTRVALPVAGILLVGGVLIAIRASSLTVTVWHQAVLPGQLSRPHAFLDRKCGDCHTPVKGVEASNCIVCHSNNESLLQRQPTAFHGDIGSCKECHAEHSGRIERPIEMDHEALVDIGLRRLSRTDINVGSNLAGSITDYVDRNVSKNAESRLNCSTCHSKEDLHSGQFGLNCAACHTTDGWSVPSYRHPSPRSRDCAQCHLGPPCHHTSHFRLVCAQVTAKPKAKVNECYECHQNTAWNDIKGVGWFKTH